MIFLDKLLNSKTRIIQSSPPRTGSTLLVNILYGLFCYDSNVCYDSNTYPSRLKLETNFIIKTHQTNLVGIKNKIINYDLLFVCSKRPEIKRELKIKNTDINYIIVDYTNDLCLIHNKTYKSIITNIYKKLETKLPKHIANLADIELAIKRIEEMNKYYETIKDKPFSFINKYYHIHGSHKNNRGK